MYLVDFSIIQTIKDNERIRLDVSQKGWRHREYSNTGLQKDYDVSYSFIEQQSECNLKSIFEKYKYRNLFNCKFTNLPMFSLVCKRKIQNDIDSDDSNIFINKLHSQEMYWDNNYGSIIYNKGYNDMGLLISMVRLDLYTTNSPNVNVYVTWTIPQDVIDKKCNLDHAMFNVIMEDIEDEFKTILDSDICFNVYNNHISANIITKKRSNDSKYTYFIIGVFQNLVEFLYTHFNVVAVSRDQYSILFQYNDTNNEMIIDEFYKNKNVSKRIVTEKRNKVKILHYASRSYEYDKYSMYNF